MDEAKVREVVEVLNRIHEKDPIVLPTLINYRVPCNEELAADPTVQVGRTKDGWEVGFLGIINGICGVNAEDIGYIAAYFEKGKGLVRFEWQDVERRSRD